MSATLCAFILTFSTLCGSRVVSGVLSQPRNVRLTSYNMNLVLRWDPPEGAASGLVYTTEYSSPRSGSVKACVNISHCECDITALTKFISQYGTYLGQVRAQLGAEISDWAKSDLITLDKYTTIGSPNVSLLSNGASIEVSIKDPAFTLSTLRNVYHYATYNITYWKDGQEGKVQSLSGVKQNRVVLSDLEVWTKYCIQVQIYTLRSASPSEASTPVCESTTIREEVPWVAALVTFVILAVVVTLVVVAVVYRKNISHFLCPKDALPQHFKEYLLAPPNSSNYIAMWNSQPPKEIYDPVSIIADDSTVDEGRPLKAAGPSCSKQPDVTSGET
ncbi:interleukin-10 receptor subunit beta [Dicentrarchus labrax]|uniref:Fibronectin type-III domain-containing protein n=1 Tax=Dicentrarchus labrax TaxID=13489 RepID=A0A8C4GW18_DICLA|nr:interleukin-10 receptor subunit beta [Dicentrarchus labrax]